MSKIPYSYLLILFIVMWVVYRWRLRKVARAIRIRFDERLAQRARIARELYDTMLQTVQGCKLVVDDALERPNDIAHMRGAMEKLSNWLGQATLEGQQALKSLSRSTVEKHDD